MIEYLKSVDTPTLSNAIELLKLRPQSAGFTPLEIRCLFPELGRMCGYAVTAQVETVTQADPTGREMFVPLYEAVAKSPKPAVVVFQEIGAHPNFAAHCGEVMATCFTRLGAVGLVSDSGVRDLPEVRALKFHYFSRGAVCSHAYFRIIRVSCAVTVCGMPVRCGDLLHGDENGVLHIPHEAVQQLPEMVERVRTRERALMDYVRSPEFSLEALRTRMVE
jgi:regulator of RNase E activity RraA